MRWVRRAAAIAAIGLLVAALASRTPAGAGGGEPDSGLKGRVVPCGLVLERAAPCAARDERVSVVVGQGDHRLRTVKTHDGGRFRVPLEAGDYWLRPRAGKTRGARVAATVDAGEWTSVTLVAGRVAPPGRR
jgi:hypothetical protein